MVKRVDSILVATITEKAAMKVKEFIQREGRPQTGGLRLYVTGGGCSGLSYGLALEDEPAQGDIVIEQYGLKLFIDQLTAPHVRGSVIDYSEQLLGGGFKIENPNVKATCACGHSFST